MAGGRKLPQSLHLHQQQSSAKRKDNSSSMILIFALDYPKAGNSGGWSASAKHRPLPIVAYGEIEFEQVTRGEIGGKSFSAIAAGKRRRKFTAFDLATMPATLLRRDYALEDLRKLGADVPKIYFDELGNMRGENDQLIMAGPRGES